MSDLVKGVIGGTVSVGRFVVNEYVLTVSEIEDGYRLTVQKGTEVQTADLQSLSPEEIETIRAAEQGRVDAEALRALAENARAAAEAQREAAEADRVSTEEAREIAEGIRAGAEDDRAQAEGVRNTAETARASAEAQRVLSENARAAAETQRAGAETARATAETAREQAEADRVTESAGAVANAEAATASANAAATESESRTTAAIADMRGTVDGYLAEAADALIDVTERAGAPVIIAEAGPAKPLILTDGAIDAPVSRVALSIQPLQSGGGVPSPTNVRPITGWTGANITRCGKNLLDPAKYNTVRVTVDGDAITVKSTAYNASIFSTQTAGKIDVPRLIPIPAGALTISCASIVSNTDGGSTNMQVITCDPDGANRTVRGTLNAETLQLTFTRDAPGLIDLQAVSNKANLTITRFQLEVGNAATEYEAWNGARAASDWSATAGTVYGGTADLTDGTLVSECAVTTIGALTWEYYDDDANGKYFRTRIYNIQGIPNKTGSDEYLASSAYSVSQRATAFADMPDCSIKENRYNTSPYGQYIYLRDLRFTTEADLKAAMGDVQIVYRKATPDTFAVDPVVLTTLKGFNAITADCGPIAVEYSADTQTYIDARGNAVEAGVDAIIADGEATATATRNYAAGTFFIMNGTLYRATTAISTGETLTPGTNCAATTVAEQLEALYNLINA